MLSCKCFPARENKATLRVRPERRGGFVCVFFLICIHAFPPFSWIHLTKQILPAEVSTVKGVPLIFLSENQGPLNYRCPFCRVQSGFSRAFRVVLGV